MVERDIYPDDAQLRQLLHASEDNLVERKTEGDSKDVLRTAVAFANSVEIGRCAVLFVGVRDNGGLQGIKDPDRTQRSLGDKLESAYPPISYQMRVIVEDGKQILCILVPGSEKRPHFTGGAYIRVGSRTVQASDDQFQRLIEDRQSKPRLLRSLRGKTVRVDYIRRDRAELLGRVASSTVMTVEHCGGFSLTLRDQYQNSHQIGLERVAILQDPIYPGSLALEISQD